MNQQKAKITNIADGKEWGVFKIQTIHWDKESRLAKINVDFGGETAGMWMLNHNESGVFINGAGNLKATIIQE